MSSDLLRSLRRHNVDQHAWIIQGRGVANMSDLGYLTTYTGLDVISTIECWMNVTTVDALRIHAAIHELSDRAVDPRSQPMYVAEVRPAVIIGQDPLLVEVQRLSNDARILASFACSSALTKLQNGQASEPSIVSECLRNATQHLERHVQGNSALLAARALRAIRRANAACSTGDFKATLTAAEKRLYDALVLATWLRMPYNTDRALFIQGLENALEVAAGGLEQKRVPRENRNPDMEPLFARLMNAFGKSIADRFPDRVFLSNAQRTAEKRGPRLARGGADRVMYNIPEDEEAETPTSPTENTQMPPRTHSRTMSDASSSGDVFARTPSLWSESPWDAFPSSPQSGAISNSCCNRS